MAGKRFPTRDIWRTMVRHVNKNLLESRVVGRHCRGLDSQNE